MEKQRINDAVVNLGNLLSKARIFVVRRLSAKIRRLRQKSNQQTSNRITRMLLEIAYLKTLSKSGTRKLLARKILVTQDDHAAKIEQESTVPEERAFHRLCKTKFIEKFIVKFREDNVDWKYWVPSLLAMWDKKVEIKTQRNVKKKPPTDQPDRVSVKDLSEYMKGKHDLAASKECKDSKESKGSKDSKGSSKRAERVSDSSDAFKVNAKRARQERTVSNATAKQNLLDSDVESHESNSNDEDEDKDKDKDKDKDSDEDEDEDAEHGDDWASKADRSLHENERDSVSPSWSSKGDNKFVRPCVSDGSSEASEDSDASDEQGELCQVPFRPYAPEYFVGESDESSDDADNDENVDQKDENVEQVEQDDGTTESDGQEPASRHAGPSNRGGLSVTQLESSSHSDDLIDDNQFDLRLDEETEDESERERRFEERIERTFKQTNARKTPQIQRSTYEPETSEEEFPSADYSDNDQDEKVNNDNGCSSGFFLRKGEIPQAVNKRTVPKEKAPGLNRRQRRGHEKQREEYTENNYSDDAATDARPSVTFGNDFRFRRKFQQREGRKDFTRAHSTRGYSNSSRDFSGNNDAFRRSRTSLPADFHRSSSNSGSIDSRVEDGKFQKQSRNKSHFQTFRTSRGQVSRESNFESSRNQLDSRFSAKSERYATRESDRVHSNSFSDTRRKSSPQTLNSVTEEKLHPSWSAKRKLAASISQPFQGRKTVFDD